LKLETLDILIAHKVLNLASELSGADKAVAGAIVDHFNRTTGRCDPSLDRIARLLGLSERTVIRATNRLAKAGIVLKSRHQGHFNCNSYSPNWFYFRRRDSEWKQRFKLLKQDEKPDLSPAKCQSCQVEDDNSVIQTIPKNQSNRTNKRWRADKSILVAESDHVSVGEIRPKSTSAAASAARSAAERRWNTELFKRYAPRSELYATIVETVDLVMQAGATEAELKIRGSGLDWLEGALRSRGVEI
jgi:predicted transcriptional regulator